MTSLDILYYCLAIAALIFAGVLAYMAYYIVQVLKSSQELLKKSIETVESLQEFKDKFSADFVKGAAISGLGFIGKQFMKKFTGSKK